MSKNDIYNRWIKYEQEKAKLQELNLPADKYERLIKQLAKELKL